MPPKRVENTKIIPDLSLQRYKFPDYNDSAILELSFLLGIDTETLIFYLVILQNYELEEGVFTSRLRARFQGMKTKQPVLESIENILQNLGLDSLSSKAWNYVMSKCSLEDNHLDVIDWAVLYMQDLIRYSLFPENAFGKFPYQESTVNSWFKQARDQGDETCGEVHILNMMGKKLKQLEPFPLQGGKNFPQEIEGEDHQLFYHGTDHKSVECILEEGIILEKGKKNSDFSHGKGFYLNNNFQEAVSWAFRIRDKKRAVLIFKIPNNVLDGFREASINLLDDEEEWQRITSHFRSAQPNKKFLKEMRRISFIEGPIASVSVRGSMKIKGQIEGSYQMCIHSDDLADQFHLNLHSIVFFE